MRWLAALAAGSFAAMALAALVLACKNFEDWQSNRASVSAQIASIERDAANPNRDRALASARDLIEVTNGAALETIGLCALVLVLAVGPVLPAWRYAARSFSRVRLGLLAAAGALIPVAIGWLVLMVLGAGAIRG
jgi:hypothetical protein